MHPKPNFFSTSIHSDSTPVFSDGSKSGAGAVYGFVLATFSSGDSLSGVATIFSAEQSAIVLAQQIIFTLPVLSFTLFSDSRSVLFALDSFTSLTHLILFFLE